MKAIVLAAGLGSRLRPLTDRLPKPLVPVCGRPCIEPILDWLAAGGVHEVGINTHWLPEQLHAHLGDGSRWGVELTWRHEPELLDGFGTVKAFEDFLAEETCLLVNGDVVFDFALAPLLETHRRVGAALTLAVTPIVGPMLHPVAWDDESRLRGIRRTGLDDPAGRHQGVFTGIHVVEPEVWRSHVPPGQPWHLSKHLCPRLLAHGVPVGCHLADGLWVDMGSYESLDRAHVQVLAARSRRYLKPAIEVRPDVWCAGPVTVEGELIPPVWLGPGCRVEVGATVGPYAAVAAGVTVPAGTRVQYGLYGADSLAGTPAQA